MGKLGHGPKKMPGALVFPRRAEENFPPLPLLLLLPYLDPFQNPRAQAKFTAATVCMSLVGYVHVVHHECHAAEMLCKSL